MVLYVGNTTVFPSDADFVDPGQGMYTTTCERREVSRYLRESLCDETPYEGMNTIHYFEDN